MEEFVLEIKEVSKEFPGVRALKNVCLGIHKGEIHAIVGENGAGKSTLSKIIAGIYTKDSGETVLDKRPVDISSPWRARELGIAMVAQELDLIGSFSVMKNLLLGQEPLKHGLIDWKTMKKNASELLNRLGISINPTIQLMELPIGQQQLVAIVKALAANPRIIILDEPTSSLGVRETENLHSVLRDLKQSGVTIIYISHRLEDVMAIADRVTIMRDGEIIETTPVADIDIDTMVSYMVGKRLEDQYPTIDKCVGKTTFAVQGLSSDKVHDVSFDVRRGEIVGVFGLVGSGRTELAKAIFGIDKKTSGRIILNGQEVSINHPRDAIRQGVVLVPEDRREQGFVPDMFVRENISLANIDLFCRWGLVNLNRERNTVKKLIDDLDVQPPYMEIETRLLSGGNQQKVVLAKWLCGSASLFILDEPTRGVDVGAKREIYYLIQEILRGGAGVILISSELPELLAMANRILVMYQGQIVAELDRSEFSEEKILSYALMGGKVAC